jgi:hypothetical protein
MESCTLTWSKTLAIFYVLYKFTFFYGLHLLHMQIKLRFIRRIHHQLTFVTEISSKIVTKTTCKSVVYLFTYLFVVCLTTLSVARIIGL